MRTIQRIEAGTEPKGYTLRALASCIGISKKDLLIAEILLEEINVVEPVLPEENVEIFNARLVKIINLSSVPFARFPIVNFSPSLIIMFCTKEKSEIVKQIMSLQILLAIVSPIIFMEIALLKLGSESVMMTIILLILANVYIILRNT